MADDVAGGGKTMPRLITFVALALLLGLPFCSPAADSPTIRSSYAAVSGAFAPIWVAQEKGLFGKYGVNLELKYILPATATQALIARSLDICNPGGELIEAGLTGQRRLLPLQQAGPQILLRREGEGNRRDAARLDHRLRRTHPGAPGRHDAGKRR